MTECTFFLNFHSLRRGQQRDFSLGLLNGKGIPASRHLPALRAIGEAARAWAEPASSVKEEPAPSATLIETREISDYLYSDGSLNQSRLRLHLGWLSSEGAVRRLSCQPGAVVAGPCLFGREELLRAMRLELKAGHSLSLRAPRRFGKTSLLYALKADASASMTPVPCELWGITSPEEFVCEIMFRLWEERDRRKAQCLRERIRKELSAAQPDVAAWTKKAEAVIPRNGAVLLLDEFSEFLRSLRESKRIGEFVRWLADSLRRGRFQVACASSRAEAWILRSRKLELPKEIVPMNVPPLNRGRAAELMEELCYSEGISLCPTDVPKLLDLMGEGIPYFIHMAVQAWKSLLSQQPSPEDVYYRGLLGPAGYNLLREFQRLPTRYPPAQQKGAHAILDALSWGAAQEARLRRLYKKRVGGDDDFRDSLERLGEDWLIRKTSKTEYAFSSKILQDFWRNYPHQVAR
ncbi:MAG: hypothetical protein A3G41_01030 [Elusimicrobia bacterium RIFCSPLOWO2_12_FULL_59_9]|nr:MAG: hypothetical protein A3G41_01030 [Elusimicrobia bacterium RIFCSPLOWO2_12_FULL_59_9]